MRWVELAEPVGDYVRIGGKPFKLQCREGRGWVDVPIVRLVGVDLAERREEQAFFEVMEAA